MGVPRNAITASLLLGILLTSALMVNLLGFTMSSWSFYEATDFKYELQKHFFE